MWMFSLIVNIPNKMLKFIYIHFNSSNVVVNCATYKEEKIYNDARKIERKSKLKYM